MRHCPEFRAARDQIWMRSPWLAGTEAPDVFWDDDLLSSFDGIELVERVAVDFAGPTPEADFRFFDDVQVLACRLGFDLIPNGTRLLTEMLIWPRPPSLFGVVDVESGTAYTVAASVVSDAEPWSEDIVEEVLCDPPVGFLSWLPAGHVRSSALPGYVLPAPIWGAESSALRHRVDIAVDAPRPRIAIRVFTWALFCRMVKRAKLDDISALHSRSGRQLERDTAAAAQLIGLKRPPGRPRNPPLFAP